MYVRVTSQLAYIGTRWHHKDLQLFNPPLSVVTCLRLAAEGAHGGEETEETCEGGTIPGASEQE